jgi:tripartite-type tricarboxylate transporter receptor subunit TctC
MRKKTMLFILILSLLTLPHTAVYAAEKLFYEGKTISIIVTTKPGGGYDFYARLMSKYMQKYLPGSTVIVKNIPGAGHIVGTNAIYQAKPDGLTIGTFNRALALAQVAGYKGIKFDQGKMNWIGIACTELHSFLVSNKFKTLQDVLKADQVRLVSEGIGALNYIEPILFEHMTGTKNFKIATNYGGTEQQLAVMRGEADGCFASWASWLKFVQEGNGRPVLFIGEEKPKGYENVPFLSDVIKDKKHTPIINLLNSINMLGRPFAAPPGVPQDRLEILRTAFKKACTDPEAVKIADKAEKPLEYIGPEKAAEYTKNLLNVSPEITDLLKKAHGM